jgi:hypothetical protein
MNTILKHTPDKYIVRIPFSFFNNISSFSICMHTLSLLYLIPCRILIGQICVQITGLLNLSHQIYFDTFFYNQLYKYILSKKNSINTSLPYSFLPLHLFTISLFLFTLLNLLYIFVASSLPPIFNKNNFFIFYLSFSQEQLMSCGAILSMVSHGK